MAEKYSKDKPLGIKCVQFTKNRAFYSGLENTFLKNVN